MSKKVIIITAAAGLVSFAGAFALAWLTKTTPAAQGDKVEQEMKLKLPPTGAGTISAVEAADSKIKRAMTEKQLKNLVYEVREKVKEYEGKLQGLEEREQRLQAAHNMIKKDIEELNNLRIELASIVARLKSERDKLLKSKLEIAKIEKVNLMSIAATYDKMDPSRASEILTNMSRVRDGGVGSGSLDDAVKILHYMAERTKAKLLAELVTSEPKLAAALCQRLKQVIEEE